MTVDRSGNVEWKVNGRLHREDGAALIWKSGTREWYLNGVNHRDGAPARVYPDGTEQWFHHGILHRVDGPAMVFPGGSEDWYFHGELHRVGGPARVVVSRQSDDAQIDLFASGREEQWFFHGDRHRLDGPAILTPDGHREWWVYGRAVAELGFHGDAAALDVLFDAGETGLVEQVLLVWLSTVEAGEPVPVRELVAALRAAVDA